MSRTGLSPPYLMRQLPRREYMIMMEIANAIARFLRSASKDLKVDVARVQRSNARVRVDNEYDIAVEWFKGGARVGNRRFYYDDITKQFDFEEIMEYVGGLLVERKRIKQQRLTEEQTREAFKMFKDVARNDKRVDVAYYSYDNTRPFHVTFKTANMSALMPILDFLLDIDDGVELPAPRPQLQDVTYELRTQYNMKPQVLTLRDVARLDHLTDAGFDDIVAMAVGNMLAIGVDTITRIS